MINIFILFVAVSAFIMLVQQNAIIPAHMSLLLYRIEACMPATLMTTEMVNNTVILDTTFKEAMSLLRVSRSTLYRIMGSGKLTCKKVGATWRLSRAELLSENVFYSAPVPKVA